MYPVIRMFWQLFKHRNDPPLTLFSPHVSQHYCLPWDIDLWMELNNGRTLTLFDLGRIPLARRTNLMDVLRAEKWGLTMAGAVVRYRRRIRAFEKVEMRSKLVGWDDRFMYLEQSMWKKNGECANHVAYRAAVTSKDGIVPTADLLAAMGRDDTSPVLPPWIAAWLDAEDKRPWPPMQE